MKHFIRLAVLIAGCALPLIGTVGPASAADNTTREALSFAPETVAWCAGGAEVGLGFDLVRNIHTFTDRTGTVIRESRNVNFTGIFQLMGTDQTYTFQGTRMVTIDFVAGTFNSVGNYRTVTQPGVGIVFHKTGRELYDDYGLLFSSGPKYSEESPEAQADVCSLFGLQVA